MEQDSGDGVGLLLNADAKNLDGQEHNLVEEHGLVQSSP